MMLKLSNLPPRDVLAHIVDKKPLNYFDDEINIYFDGVLPGGNVTKSYVDEATAATLEEAKSYTDSEIAKVSGAKLYSDYGDNEDGSVTQKFFTSSMERAKNLPIQVFYDTSLTEYNSDNVDLHIVMKDLHTGGDATKSLMIEGATSERAGVMTIAQVEALEEAGQNIDLATKDIENINKDIDNLEANKQDVLESGVTIKTVNNHSLLGEGNLTIEGGEPETVTTDEFNNIWENS